MLECCIQRLVFIVSRERRAHVKEETGGGHMRMGWRKSFGKAVQDGVRQQRAHPAASTAMPNSIEILRACPVSQHGKGRSHPKQQGLSNCFGAASYGTLLSREVVAERSQQSRNFAAGAMEARMASAPGSSMRIAGIHVGRTADARPFEPTYGVGPVGGADRDPKTKGSTPDDFRADDIHMAEPKEIAKEKVAIAQEEPPDFQVKKMMPEWEKPIREEADSQRDPGDEVFEGNTRKLEGSAEKEGDTTGLESDQKVESQYGATPSEGKTSRG